MPFVNKMAIAAWGIVLICLAIWALAMFEPDFTTDYRAAASQNQVKVLIGEVSCVSIDTRKIIFDEKKFSDPGLPDAITNVLSIKDVFLDADVARCPWSFGITGISRWNYNVTYGGEFSRYLASISICQRNSDGQVNINKCLSKNIYVFNRNVEPHKLFVVALTGLARVQGTEWEAYQIEKEKL
jgi:hypothetical protein